MDNYSRILFATDLGPQSLYIGQQALNLSKLCQAQLFVLHIVEPTVTFTRDFAEREKQLTQSRDLASKSLAALCSQLNIDAKHQMIKIGSPQGEILTVAEEIQSDLIIVGSHGIGGYTHALGSTAHNLLEQTHCDVLIVQVSHLQKEIEKQMPKGEYLWVPPPLPNSPGWVQGPKQSGSVKGFGEVVRRGPRLTNRPSTSPYKGGTRTRTSEDEDNNDKQ